MHYRLQLVLPAQQVITVPQKPLPPRSVHREPTPLGALHRVPIVRQASPV